jgi:DNA-binding LytR/AlgR family response regulator
MNVLIIENERPASDRLCRLLKKLDGSHAISGIIESVEGAINWFRENKFPDLILMDIQLDDGLCFEIFETVKIDSPVIFTTAYDEYTLKAFKVNSVDYLLKPVQEEQLEAALTKFRKIYSNAIRQDIDYRQIAKEFTNRFKSRFLVKAGGKYKSVPVIEISYFHILERSVFLKDFNGKECGIDYSLDQLVDLIDPEMFFRINRDCVVNINSILSMNIYSSTRLQLVLKNEPQNENFIVSRDRVPDFKKWLDR